METSTYTNDTKTTRTRAGRTRKAAAAKQTDIPRTPESELMSVEEYFDLVWNRYVEKYEKLHS